MGQAAAHHRRPSPLRARPRSDPRPPGSPRRRAEVLSTASRRSTGYRCRCASADQSDNSVSISPPDRPRGRGAAACVTSIRLKVAQSHGAAKMSAESGSMDSLLGERPESRVPFGSIVRSKSSGSFFSVHLPSPPLPPPPPSPTRARREAEAPSRRREELDGLMLPVVRADEDPRPGRGELGHRYGPAGRARVLEVSSHHLAIPPFPLPFPPPSSLPPLLSLLFHPSSPSLPHSPLGSAFASEARPTGIGRGQSTSPPLLPLPPSPPPPPPHSPSLPPPPIPCLLPLSPFSPW